MRQILERIHWARGIASIAALAVCFAMAGPAVVSAVDYEYEPDEGVHMEEWYDPSDWFNSDEVIDYETDWWDYTYNYPTVYSYDYDYDYPYEGYYGDDVTPYGEWEYGWHYDYYTDTWYEDDDDVFIRWYE